MSSKKRKQKIRLQQQAQVHVQPQIVLSSEQAKLISNLCEKGGYIGTNLVNQSDDDDRIYLVKIGMIEIVRQDNIPTGYRVTEKGWKLYCGNQSVPVSMLEFAA
jgi:hypothetical protein